MPGRRDKRSFRVALVADKYVNPTGRGLDAMPILLEEEWGVIQLPADVYPRGIARPLLEQVAEQTEEFHRHGYDVVVIGRRTGLKEALAASGVPPLDHLDPANAAALQAFLRKRPPPSAARTYRRPARATVKEA